MIKAAIIGATGYAGVELTRLLLRHKNVEIVKIGSQSYTGQFLSEVYPIFNKVTDLKLSKPDLKEFAKKADVVFLALPHGIASKEVNQEILNQTVIIDLGADFRLNSIDDYEKWYQTKNYATAIIKDSVYGLVELYRDQIKRSRLIANPGCYTTTSILALVPLLKSDLIDPDTIIIDAASGVTGAGRSTKLVNSFCEVDEDYKAYGLVNHRHTPEIEQELSKAAGKNVTINFTPHLIPMERGILATSYASLKSEIDLEQIKKVYKEFYKNDYFVRILDNQLPQTKFVKGSNFIDINFKLDPRTNRIIVLSALDNLIKGAAGQAVQNMNVVFNLDEKEGIDMIPDSLI